MNKEIDILNKAWLDDITKKSEIHIQELTKGITPCDEILFKWDLNIIKKYIPDISMFANSELYDSIHGVRHIVRVMIFVDILARSLDIDSTPAIIAASFHDLMRINDFSDLNHGERSADLFLSKVDKGYFNDLSKNTLELIEEAIRNHDKKNTNLRNNEYLSLLKAGDALDRYRLKNEKGWIDKNVFSLPLCLRFAPLFRMFTLKTEYDYLNTKNSLSAIYQNIDYLRGSNANR